MQQAIITNGELLDEYCTLKNANIIGNDLKFTCTLNQTDIKTNKNKFYIMQLLKDNNNIILYTRYGRIGEIGISATKHFTSEERGKQEFMKIFTTKTRNTFGTQNFNKYNDKYYMSEIKYDLPIIIQTPEIQVSNLHTKVKYLIELISDRQMMTNTLVTLNIDTKKMPLGKISSNQINEARNILQSIANKINNIDLNLPSYDFLSSQYYTLIPHSFGRRKPTIIETLELLSIQNETLDNLENMVIATNLVGNTDTNSPNGIDIIYKNLNAEIIPVDENSFTWEMINRYVLNTHGHTHGHKIKVEEIYEIKREGEKELFNNYENRILLFHGSILSNYCSILQKGLILNPEILGIPIAGKMFGYGLYFTNCVTKSLRYTRVCGKEKGVMLLCDISLGNQLKCISSNSSLNKMYLNSKGYQSTWGQGENTVTELMQVDDYSIPSGKIVKSNIDSDLVYDEFIVYDTNQVCIKYLMIFSLL